MHNPQTGLEVGKQFFYYQWCRGRSGLVVKNRQWSVTGNENYLEEVQVGQSKKWE